MNTPYFLRQGKNSTKNHSRGFKKTKESTFIQKNEPNTHRQAFGKNNMDIDKKGSKGVTNDHTLTR